MAPDQLDPMIILDVLRMLVRIKLVLGIGIALWMIAVHKRSSRSEPAA